MRDISAHVHGNTIWASTRYNAYIIVYLQFLPCKNYSGLGLGFFFCLFLGFLFGLSLLHFPLVLGGGQF